MYSHHLTPKYFCPHNRYFTCYKNSQYVIPSPQPKAATDLLFSGYFVTIPLWVFVSGFFIRQTVSRFIHGISLLYSLLWLDNISLIHQLMDTWVTSILTLRNSDVINIYVYIFFEYILIIILGL